jgi:hypothetical protein
MLEIADSARLIPVSGSSVVPPRSAGSARWYRGL